MTPIASQYLTMQQYLPSIPVYFMRMKVASTAIGNMLAMMTEARRFSTSTIITMIQINISCESEVSSVPIVSFIRLVMVVKRNNGYFRNCPVLQCLLGSPASIFIFVLTLSITLQRIRPVTGDNHSADCFDTFLIQSALRVPGRYLRKQHQEIRTGTPSRTVTTAFSRSDTSLISQPPDQIFYFVYLHRFAPISRLLFLTAFIISITDILKARMASGFSSI